MAIVSLQRSDREKLISKDVFDKVEKETSINGKPSVVAEGLSRQKTSDSVNTESKDEKPDDFILACSPNLYKQIGDNMENLGYFIIPRSVSDDPRYQGARLKYQKVLFTILKHAAFSPTTHAIGSKLIPISVGQLCVSVRGLSDLCNVGVKFKEDLIDKNIVERASHFWASCQYLRQEVRHGKILITITIPEIYVRQKQKSETESETKVRQNRDTKEEDKEDKQEDILSSIVADAPSDVADAPPKKKKIFSSKKRKKVEPIPVIERDKGVFTSEIAHQKLIEEKGSEEIVKKIYSEMAIWKAEKGVAGGNDYKTALNWSISPKRPQRAAPKPEDYYPKDTTPSNPKKFISFAKEV